MPPLARTWHVPIVRSGGGRSHRLLRRLLLRRLLRRRLLLLRRLLRRLSRRRRRGGGRAAVAARVAAREQTSDEGAEPVEQPVVLLRRRLRRLRRPQRRELTLAVGRRLRFSLWHVRDAGCRQPDAHGRRGAGACGGLQPPGEESGERDRAVVRRRRQPHRLLRVVPHLEERAHALLRPRHHVAAPAEEDEARGRRHLLVPQTLAQGRERQSGRREERAQRDGHLRLAVEEDGDLDGGAGLRHHRRRAKVSLPQVSPAPAPQRCCKIGPDRRCSQLRTRLLRVHTSKPQHN